MSSEALSLSASADLDRGWTEYSITLGHSPAGHCLAVLRKRTATSARVIRNSRSTMAAWGDTEFQDIWTELETYVKGYLIVTSGLQLTLPLD
jgi:hypothetical protein